MPQRATLSRLTGQPVAVTPKKSRREADFA